MTVKYHVKLERRVGVAEDEQLVTVEYEAVDYHEAWVGARTVCRMGTTAPDVRNARVFRNLDDERSLFQVQAGTFTVRGIFHEHTRKRGRQRMTTITEDQLMGVIKGRNIAISKKLEGVLRDVLKESEHGGLRITTAVARRLGIDVEEDAPQLPAPLTEDAA